MKSIYHKIIEFSSTHSDVEEHLNLNAKDLKVKQIIRFVSTSKDIEFFSYILPLLDDSIYIESDEKELNNKSIIQDIENNETDIKIVLTYDLRKLSDFYIIKNKNVKKILQEMIREFKLKDIQIINKNINMYSQEEDKTYLFKFETDWTAFLNDNYYTEKSILILPQLMPQTFQKNFSLEIFKAFIDLITERKINDDYLIRIGDSKTINFEGLKVINEQEISIIYSIITYIFNDSFRYDDKLKIIRKILSDELYNNNISDIVWEKVLQMLQYNYSLFINLKLEDFIKLNISLTNQILEIKQKINENIDNKIEEFTKQIVLIIATIISSFIIKIGGGFSQVVLIISAIIYTSIILWLINLKGIHFSSDGLNKGKEQIESLEQSLIALNNESIDDTIKNEDSTVQEAIDKLKKVENFQNSFLMAVLLFLVIICLIA